MRSNYAIGIAFGAALFAAPMPSQTTDSKPARDEFDVNITDSRINEADFKRSVAASLESDNVRVLVGASVSASMIDVTLRNVTGHVTFRVSIDALRRRMERLQPQPSH